MAMYLFGAKYSDQDKTSDFISHNGAFIGHDEKDASPLFILLDRIVVGDIIVIKSYSQGNGLYIKAVGICDDPGRVILPKLGKGRSVKWLWTGNECLGVIKDYYTHFRTGSLYEELNPEVVQKIINLILNKM